jgi:exopolysaccharide production protein ExoQ
MPPFVATLLTLGLIAFLFRRDIRERPDVTGALWLPLIWIFISCSRQPSEWLNTFGFHLGAVSLEEGSPFDACVYFALIAAGACVLAKRRVQLSEIIRDNQWLTIFFVYCFLAILWSDFPLVAFKRWIKIMGHPILTLVVLTEPDPEEALKTLLKRCAYIVVPISILFIKYYPELGRGFSYWTGEAYNTGITLDKNALGADCLILGFFFAWYLLQIWSTGRSRQRRNEMLLSGGFLAAIWWLFSMAHSSTSLVSCVLGIAVLVFLGLRFVDRRLIGTYLVCAAIVFVLAQSMFDVWGSFLQFLGKDPTLTDRTKVWHDALQIHINPLLGAGFESFWLGDRLKIMWEKWTFRPNQAHNGYLETYLNLGLIGLFLLIGLLIATFRKSRRELLTNFQFGRFRVGFLVAIIAYNWTEGAFKNISATWFVFYLIAMDYPQRRPDTTQQSIVSDGVEPEEELVPAASRILLARRSEGVPEAALSA